MDATDNEAVLLGPQNKWGSKKLRLGVISFSSLRLSANQDVIRSNHSDRSLGRAVVAMTLVPIIVAKASVECTIKSFHPSTELAWKQCVSKRIPESNGPCET